jgi:hypothetical protein
VHAEGKKACQQREKVCVLGVHRLCQASMSLVLTMKRQSVHAREKGGVCMLDRRAKRGRVLF